jgi:serine protease
MAIEVLPKHSNNSANQKPFATLTVTPATPTVGETVTLDGSQSTDPDGEITGYDWSVGDDHTHTGATVDWQPTAPGEQEISLTVTDDKGDTATVRKTVTVSPQSGTCGTHKNTETATGTIANFFDSEQFSYTPELSNPCQVTVSLDGSEDADFDLYATTDGRTPKFWDHDAMSATADCQETVILEDVEQDRPIGILVDCWAGSGSFTLSIEEVGR